MTLKSMYIPIAALSVLAVTPASAAQLLFLTNMTGGQEVPVVASPGKGWGEVRIDTVANTMRVITSFSGLVGNTTVAHIHCCAPAGSNAAVATQTPSFIGFPVGVKAGFYDNVFDMTLASSYRAGFITANGGTTASAFAALQAGLIGQLAYLNVHSSFATGGEIRGQFAQSVPEPASWAMMILGFGIAGVALRRRSTIFRDSRPAHA